MLPIFSSSYNFPVRRKRSRSCSAFWLQDVLTTATARRGRTPSFRTIIDRFIGDKCECGTRSIRNDSVMFSGYTEAEGWALPRAVLYRSYEPRRESMNTPRQGARVGAVPKKAEGKP